MMIAEKLLACATPAPVDPGSTLFLSNWTAIGTPTAQVGAVLPYSTTVTAAGVLDLGGGYMNCKFAPPASDDWVVDMFFDGPALPETGSAATTYLFGYDGSTLTLYLSDNRLSWTHSAAVPAGTAGRNHLAMGRQSGQMQAWLNGVRFLGGPAAGPYPWPPSGSDIQLLGGGSVGPVRVVGADIYGNSATIAVPTEPLGIV